jgi:thiamine-monophosphate kinase
VPEDLDEDGCLEALDGIAETAAATGTALAGGDVSRAAALSFAITVVGHASAPEQLVGRGGARPGDALVVTGALGGAAAGLLLEETPGAAADIPEELAAGLRRRLLAPVPRLRAGRALAEAGATAMIDLSDGLGGDARHLAERSGVGLRIDGEALPVDRGVAKAAGGEALRLAVSGGEDYELLAALPEADGLDLAALAERAGVALTRVGEAVAGEGVEIRLPGGRSLEPAGYDQLA